MALKGKALGFELAHLVHVLQHPIPDMAKIYQKANESLDRTSDVTSATFASDEVGTGQFAAAWMSARDRFQNAMGDTQDNLQDTAKALTALINHFLSDDGAVGDGLRGRIDDINDAASGTHPLPEGEDDNFKHLDKPSGDPPKYDFSEPDKPNVAGDE